MKILDDMRFCECGCGEPIPLARFNRPKDGLIRGQQSPARFLRGHHLKVSRPSWWKGDDASYRAIHTYLQKHFPKAGACEECGRFGKTDYALIKGCSYSRDRADYRELCRRCHVAYDDIELLRLNERRAQAAIAARALKGGGPN